MNKEEKKYDLYINWLITSNCNFSCDFCDKENHQKNENKPLNIEKIIKRIDKLNKTVLINFTGGEPFLIPNFIKLVMELSKKHFISIDTNFSQHPALNKFLESVDPNRIIKITFSTHVIERENRKEDLEELCLLINKFQDRGFRIYGNYVIHPPLVKRMEKDINFFKERNIKILAPMFIGKYKNKKYPVDDYGVISYSKEEMETIKKFTEKENLTNFKTKGRFCLAGSRALVINQDKISPCWMILKNLGNFEDNWSTFDRVIKCPMSYCCCPLTLDSIANYPGLDLQSKLLRKTIKECGTYSMSESKKITNIPATSLLIDKKIGLVGLFIKNKFPAVYYYIKKIIAKIKNN